MIITRSAAAAPDVGADWDRVSAATPPAAPGVGAVPQPASTTERASPISATTVAGIAGRVGDPGMMETVFDEGGCTLLPSSRTKPASTCRPTRQCAADRTPGDERGGHRR